MRAYFDTGLLLKLYTLESNSVEAITLVRAYGAPILFTGLQQTELRNALFRKAARKEMTSRELKISLGRLQGDLDAGVLHIPALEWPGVWADADRLTSKHALATQCRTLDVLHVAVALQLGVKIFATTDQRQLKLARKAGLKIATLRQS